MTAETRELAKKLYAIFDSDVSDIGLLDVERVVDAYVQEKVDQVLDEAAAIAQRHIIPGHFVQAPSCIAIANAILARKSASILRRK